MGDLHEYTTITLPKSMPLDERISEVSRKIGEWLSTLDNHTKEEFDGLRLAKYERTKKEHTYRYSVIRPENN
jgi:hypothetical protein